MTDTGIGHSARKNNALSSSRSSRSKAATIVAYGGTGLGLAISSQLVALMGGHLAVESPASGVASAPVGSQQGADAPRSPGSRFYFTARFGLAPEDTSDHGEPIDLRGLPVLIVDDNASNRLILSEMLSSWRMKPVAVEGARQALQELQDAVGKAGNRIRSCCSIRRCRRWTASRWPSRSARSRISPATQL